MRNPATSDHHTGLLCLMLLAMATQANASSATPVTKATTRQPTPLLALPVPDAAIVTELPKAAELQVLTRQGGWYQVAPAAEQPQGWVRLFALQLTKSLYRPDNQPPIDLKGLVLPGHNQVTSSTGVRGLDKVAIESANADFKALVTLQSFQQQPVTAEAFARAAGLYSEPAVLLKEVQP